MAHPINASEIWNNQDLQKAIVKYRQLNNFRNDYKSSLHFAYFLMGFIVFSLCFATFEHFLVGRGIGSVILVTALMFVTPMVVILVSLPARRSLLSQMEKDFASEKSFTDLMCWFSSSSLEDLKIYTAYAPTNVYHTFFDEYQAARKRIAHVHH